MESRRVRGVAIAMVVALLWSGASAGNISVYWGQNGTEASLYDTCESGNFEIVMLAFLTTFGNGQDLVLNLTGHCDPSSDGCKVLENEIKFCQSKGIKVFLSIGGPDGKPNITSEEDAEDVAHKLWHDYLDPYTHTGPFGDSALDGIDFAIESKTAHLDVVAKTLKGYYPIPYLSAAPQCAYPDANLIEVLQTVKFNYVWIKYYNNPSCQYPSNAVNSWDHWAISLAESLYYGLPAAPGAAPEGGYIDPDILISEVLPEIKALPKYGGVMLWNKYWDETTNYSSIIKPNVLMKPSLVNLPSLASA